ncbi:Uncharacterised protein [Mycobacteroides abscessus subsp. bolletii]|nr:hypothetical protein [Mycobacteroides abscessus]SKY97368.1 Uncharacterised protein [Mycobacteroides abscessus subsp. bolletii]
MNTEWKIYDDENNVLETIEARDEFDAQDKAQALYPDAIGLRIELSP